MATFTIALKKAIDLTHATAADYSAIGLGEYPLFDPDYRDALNKKIVDHYWNREIGVETIEMFSHIVKRKMNEIMPYYNKLYLTEKICYDPLSTMDIRTVAETSATEDVEATGNSLASTDNTSGSRAVSSSTPQTMLAGNEDYATSASDATTSSNVDSENITDNTQNTESTTNATSRVSGYQGIPANLVIRYRESLLNIDLNVIAELEECFMQVFDNGDAYTSRGWYY